MYYNYQPCLDHLRTVLDKKQRETEHFTPDESLLNPDPDTSCLLAEISDGEHVSSTDCYIEIDDDFEKHVKDMLIKNSEEYLRFFLKEKLPQSTASSHTRHVICLCQFVENKRYLATA